MRNLLKIVNKFNLFVKSKRFLSDQRVINRPIVLGIETSCDDTGVAVVDRDGNVLGECINSQQETHLKVTYLFSYIFENCLLNSFIFKERWHNSSNSTRFTPTKYC